MLTVSVRCRIHKFARVLGSSLLKRTLPQNTLFCVYRPREAVCMARVFFDLLRRTFYYW